MDGQAQELLCSRPTRDGTPCSRVLKPGAKTCWQHASGLKQRWRAIGPFYQAAVQILGLISSIITIALLVAALKPHHLPETSQVPAKEENRTEDSKKNPTETPHSEPTLKVARKHASQKSKIPAPPLANSPDVRKQTRAELADLLRQYYKITKGDCTPNMVGPPMSGAAHTPQDCENMLKDWQKKANDAVQRLFDNGSLNDPDVVAFGWSRTGPEMAEALQQLVNQLGR
jgi:hypothetical protein